MQRQSKIEKSTFISYLRQVADIGRDMVRVGIQQNDNHLNNHLYLCGEFVINDFSSCKK